jgi:hypothetical protein
VNVCCSNRKYFFFRLFPEVVVLCENFSQDNNASCCYASKCSDLTASGVGRYGAGSGKYRDKPSLLIQHRQSILATACDYVSIVCPSVHRAWLRAEGEDSVKVKFV